MKKILKALTIVGMLTPLFQGFSTTVDAAEVATKPEEVTITLHKRSFSSMPSDILNNGLVNSNFGGDPLPGVDFSLFDVTDVYYALLKDNPTTPEADDGMASQEAIKLIQDEYTATWFQNYNLVAEKTVTTNGTGEAVFDQLKVTEAANEKRDKAYLFLETYSPADIAKVAAPMVVLMPVMMPDTNNPGQWLDTYNDDIHLYPKNETQESSKAMNIDPAELRKVTLSDGTEISYADLEKGYLINYTITAPIPYFIDSVNNGKPVINNFTIEDKPTAGLTYFNQGLVVTAGTTELTLNEDYTLEEVDNGFKLTILTEKDGTANTTTLAKLAAARGGQLTVNYAMKLTATITPDDLQDNTAKIAIGRGDAYDYSEDVTPPEKVATGGRQFEKYDASSKAKLAGAEFELWDAAKEKYAVFYKDGTALSSYQNDADRVEWVDDQTGATKFVSLADTGKFEVQGLEYGTYYMKEVKAADGYALPTGDAAFTAFTVELGSYSGFETIGQPTDVEVPNTKKGALPSTGGNGIYLFLLIGSFLMLAAYSGYRKLKKPTEI
ncbi:SpaH/EbpB family LPXTG-anchored major pilin [Candidatus Enterococcus courvalinii]|uniref:SpaH/EbpB family LPXTG-anchored major pilin n=1 Tax=Candidatus Enterococcus courvalinii TaxID=2815329 RepID=A0ABS3I3D5_9ENTE|nr:SpaH/EbpB family LPXTG-anchored major pilin [Enterococcus sp. MSG2901]MBO0482697.1 SpaH/EbpB family LPXTG-anchored major pilin [Enterococcus sp. MSG2901]